MTEPVTTIESEKSILGTTLYNPDLFGRLLSLMSADDLYYPEHRRVFQAMQELFYDNLDINVQSILNVLTKKRDTSVNEHTLFGYLEYRVTPEIALSFAVQISEFSGFRNLGQTLEKVVLPSIKKREHTLDKYVADLSSLVSSVSQKGMRQGVVHGQHLREEYLNMLARDRSKFHLTGIPSIDKTVVDFDKKELIIIAARPSVGKTAMLLKSAAANVASGVKVGFISMEMDKTKILNRLISRHTKVNGLDLLKVKPADLYSNVKLSDALDYYTDSPLYIDDAGPFSTETIPKKIRYMVYEYGCEVIYVDYLGLISAPGVNRTEQITVVSSTLKGLATELDIPIVAASQLNRDVEKRIIKRPVLADLRESGSIEQDATIVAFLYLNMEHLFSSDFTEEDVKRFLEKHSSVPVVFEIQKQRNGPLLLEKLMFNKPYGEFELDGSKVFS